MGLETALAVIGTTAAVAGAATGIVGAVKGSKKPKLPEPEKPKLLSPVDDGKNLAQRNALIKTGPAGLNDEPTLGRNKLLGN